MDKYAITIPDKKLKSVVARIKDNGFSGKDYSMWSYRPLDKNDKRTINERKVTLDDGSVFIQPHRRIETIRHKLLTDNAELYKLVNRWMNG